MTGPRVDVLGPPRVIGRNAQEQDHLRKKTVGILAYLLVEGRPVGRDTLATLFWPECGQSAARRNLRTCLSEARSALGEQSLESSADHLGVNLSTIGSDYLELTSLSECPPGRIAPGNQWDEGTESVLCVGEFLEGFTLPDSVAFDQWQHRAEERVRTLRMRTVRAVIEDALTRGEAASVVDLSECLLRLDRLDEAAHRLAMRVLAAAGHWDRAQQQYHRCTEALAEELDAEPEATTVALYERVRNRDPELTCCAAPGAAPRKRSPAATPRGRDTLFGRDAERERIRTLLQSEDVGLITLTGTAGSGKTHLAVHLCQDVAADTAKEIVFVDLTVVREAPEVLHAICASAGIRDRAGTNAELIYDLSDQLDGRDVLIVLDNFEHVIDAAADVSEVLSRVRGPRFLVTSREALRVAGEVEVAVPPLELPRSDSTADILASPAVQLFLDRARRTDVLRGDYHEALGAIRRICTLLDGLPLALELVVPLLRMHAPEELCDALPGSPSLYWRSRRDAPERHRSLQAAFDWSYELLTATEKRLFAELSLFPNGYDYDAVEGVYAGVLDPPTLQEGFAGLLEKNLLRSSTDLETRSFGMLEPLRQYGQAKCASDFPDTDVRERHAAYFARRVDELRADLHGSRQRETLRTLAGMHENLIAAMERLRTAGEVERGLKLATDLMWYWYLLNHARVGRHWLTLFMEEARKRGLPQDPRASFGIGLMTFLLGAWREAGRRFRASARLAEERGDRSITALSRGYRGLMERWLGDTAEGWRHQQEALEMAHALGEPVTLTMTRLLAHCTSGGAFPGEPPLTELEAGLELATAMEDAWSIAHFHNGLGDLYCTSGDAARARSEYLRSAQQFAELGDRYMEAWNYEGLGRVALQEGNHEAALAWTSEALQLWDRIGDELNCALLLARAAHLASILQPSDPLAGRLAGGALSVFSRIREEEVRDAPQVTEALDTVGRIQQDDPAAFDAGRTLTRAAAVHLAVSAGGCGEDRPD